MKLWQALVVLAVVAGGWRHCTTAPVTHGPGVRAPDAPLQGDADGKSPFVHDGFRLTPLARFALRARVLGVEPYRLGREAALSPVDLALGWGRMSDSAVLEKLEISQGRRFYFYRWSGEPPIPVGEIVSHSANMHLIPADDTIARALDAVRPGQIVEFQGLLVRADAADGWFWTSSLTRTDSGAGACELVWVQRLQVR